MEATKEKTLALFMLEKFSSDREKMERYSAIAELCPVPAFIVAHDGLSIVYVNKAYVQLTGRDLCDLQNFGWLDSVHPDDRDRARQEWRSLVATDSPLHSSRRYVHTNGLTTEAVVLAQRVEHNGYVGFIVPAALDKLVSPAGISPAA